MKQFTKQMGLSAVLLLILCSTTNTNGFLRNIAETQQQQQQQRNIQMMKNNVDRNFFGNNYLDAQNDKINLEQYRTGTINTRRILIDNNNRRLNLEERLNSERRTTEGEHRISEESRKQLDDIRRFRVEDRRASELRRRVSGDRLSDNRENSFSSIRRQIDSRRRVGEDRISDQRQEINSRRTQREDRRQDNRLTNQVSTHEVNNRRINSEQRRVIRQSEDRQLSRNQPSTRRDLNLNIRQNRNEMESRQTRRASIDRQNFDNRLNLEDPNIRQLNNGVSSQRRDQRRQMEDDRTAPERQVVLRNNIDERRVRDQTLLNNRLAENYSNIGRVMQQRQIPSVRRDLTRDSRQDQSRRRFAESRHNTEELNSNTLKELIRNNVEERRNANERDQNDHRRVLQNNRVSSVRRDLARNDRHISIEQNSRRQIVENRRENAAESRRQVEDRRLSGKQDYSTTRRFVGDRRYDAAELRLQRENRRIPAGGHYGTQRQILENRQNNAASRWQLEVRRYSTERDNGQQAVGSEERRFADSRDRLSAVRQVSSDRRTSTGGRSLEDRRQINLESHRRIDDRNLDRGHSRQDLTRNSDRRMGTETRESRRQIVENRARESRRYMEHRNLEDRRFAADQSHNTKDSERHNAENRYLENRSRRNLEDRDLERHRVSLARRELSRNNLDERRISDDRDQNNNESRRRIVAEKLSENRRRQLEDRRDLSERQISVSRVRTAAKQTENQRLVFERRQQLMSSDARNSIKENLGRAMEIREARTDVTRNIQNRNLNSSNTHRIIAARRDQKQSNNNERRMATSFKYIDSLENIEYIPKIKAAAWHNAMNILLLTILVAQIAGSSSKTKYNWLNNLKNFVTVTKDKVL